MKTRITDLFNIQYPIIQGGMIWCSGWELASAVSNAGGLGLIGAGSMYPEILREHIQKCKKATTKTFGVNIPMLYPQIEELMQIIVEEGVKVVFTSAGNPKTWTSHLQAHGIKVAHVVPSTALALKCEAAGVDAIVAEGFEAGGHNGREETTTLCLIPNVVDNVKTPIIAAGGIGSGRALLAAFALGAEGVQIGSLFAASVEASGHSNFKQQIIATKEGGTELSLKKLTPVRLIKNAFYQKVKEAELKGATEEELKAILGKRRSKIGMFEGNLEEGELEIGQVSGMIHEIKPVAQIIQDIVSEFETTALKFK